ncbi:MAG: NUDIX domain-containing protein [Bacteroidales bacterium]
MKSRSPEVKFYPPGYKPEEGLTYVIIGAVYLNRWIFVFHNSRQNYGLPAGHIVPGEEPMEAARRELAEETGALSYTIMAVATYSVDTGERKGFGRLFFAEIEKKG